MADGIITPCNVACGSGIVTVNSPSGSTLQCDTWLWDDMPSNSPGRGSTLQCGSASVSSDLKTLYKSVIIIIFFALGSKNPKG